MNNESSALKFDEFFKPDSQKLEVILVRLRNKETEWISELLTDNVTLEVILGRL